MSTLNERLEALHEALGRIAEQIHDVDEDDLPTIMRALSPIRTECLHILGTALSDVEFAKLKILLVRIDHTKELLVDRLDVLESESILESLKERRGGACTDCTKVEAGGYEPLAEECRSLLQSAQDCKGREVLDVLGVCMKLRIRYTSSLLELLSRETKDIPPVLKVIGTVLKQIKEVLIDRLDIIQGEAAFRTIQNLAARESQTE